MPSRKMGCSNFCEGWNGPFFLALSLDTPKLTLLTEVSSARHEELKSKSRPLSRGNIVKRKARMTR
jgi:hypothetical protein